MGLANETYVVHTAASGDIVVPVQSVVNYKPGVTAKDDMIKLIGYNSYQYHELISQSLVNLADAIEILKVGPVGQTQATLEEVVANAKLAIEDEVKKVNSGIISYIEEGLTKTIQDTVDNNSDMLEILNANTIIVNNTNTASTTHAGKIQALEDSVNGSNTVTGLIPDLFALTGRVENIGVSLGSKKVATSNGEVAGFGILGTIEYLEDTIGDTNRGIVKDNKNLNASLTSLQNTVGSYTPGYTIGGETILLKQTIFKNTEPPTSLSGNGLYFDIHDTTSGILKKIRDIEINTGSLGTLSTSTSNLINDTNDLKTKVQTNITNITNIQTSLGSDDTTGLRSRVKAIEDLNISTTINHVSGNSGLLTIVGNSTSGLVKDNTTNKTNIATNISDIAKLKTDVSTNTSNITTNTNDIADIELDLINIKTGSGGLSDINDFIDDISTTFDTYLTYNSVLFNAEKISEIKDDIDEYNQSNVLTQFKSYFHNGSAYIAKDSIGLETIQKWKDDETPTGMKVKTNSIIQSYLANDATYGKINTLENNITTLNGAAGVLGSVSQKVQDAKDDVVEYIDTLTDGIIADHGPRITILETAKVDHNARIVILENKEVEQNKDVDELINEAVRYNTILPFLKKMFLIINPNTNISNTDISNMFDRIIYEVDQMSNSYTNNGEVIYTKSTKTLVYIVKLVEHLLMNANTNFYKFRLRADYSDGITVDMFVSYFDEMSNVGYSETIVNGFKTLSDNLVFYKLTDDYNTNSTTRTLASLLADVESGNSSFFFDVINKNIMNEEEIESFRITIKP